MVEIKYGRFTNYIPRALGCFHRSFHLVKRKELRRTRYTKFYFYSLLIITDSFESNFNTNYPNRQG